MPAGLDDATFKEAMAKIMLAMSYAYQQGLSDALDIEDGKELEKLS